MKKYDYLIVGAGLFGCTFAEQMTMHGFKCLVIDKRNHIGGNIYTENIEGINVHKYGAHIFHTDNKKIWDYVNQFAQFNNYINSPIANYKGEIYNMPFNMNTFAQMWGITSPAQAKEIINKQIEISGIVAPKNLEEKAISLVGYDIYNRLVKGYTEKQWGKKASELPQFIINRLPLRFVYDNNYFNDRYQGIPIGGYTQICEKMLKNIDVKLNCNYLDNKHKMENIAEKIVYTGEIDRYYNYCFGKLEYRSLKFDQKVLDVDNYQGVAVVNYTDYETPYTRVIEHKHFEKSDVKNTVLTYEYPDDWDETKEPYYAINNDKNNALYERYLQKAKTDNNIIFAGRLGNYRYFDMDDTIEKAFELVEIICEK